MLVTQEKKYVSIFIAPTIDLTLSLEPNERGVAGTIGKITWGNPHYIRTLAQSTEDLKTTIPARGGDALNEFAYHLSDFFNGYQGKVLVGRLLGEDSYTFAQLVKKDNATGLFYFDNTSEQVNIFGADNITDWADTFPTQLLEVLVTAVPTETFSIDIENKNDFLTIKLYDKSGNEVYRVDGGAKFDSVDDYGNPNYIGNRTDDKILSIKVDTQHPDYTSDFELSDECDCGLVNDDGNTNYDNALSVLANVIEQCDYSFTGGLTDTESIKKLRGLTYGAKVLLAVDVMGKTLTDALQFKNAIGISESDITYLWNRGKDDFEAGDLNIGLSGWLVGQAINRNMSRLVDGVVEYRVEGVAGVDYPLPRTKAQDLGKLSDEDLTSLTENRLNTVRMFGNILVLGDCLSGEMRNVASRLFPVTEGNFFINRSIANILIQMLFKNLNEAQAFTLAEVTKLFDRCARNNYFDANAETQYDFQVTTKDNDTVVVKYRYVPSGVMRRGVIEGTLTKKIQK